jgi:DnaK suppressor protein
MDTSRYRKRLLEIERKLAGRAGREISLGREQVRDVAEDSGHASVADEAASTDFVSAEQDTEVLGQVRAALERIDAGTFGQCVVDGAPIDAARLEAVPWTPYCLKHQTIVDNTGAPLP